MANPLVTFIYRSIANGDVLDLEQEGPGIPHP